MEFSIIRRFFWARIDESRAAIECFWFNIDFRGFFSLFCLLVHCCQFFRFFPEPRVLPLK